MTQVFTNAQPGPLIETETLAGRLGDPNLRIFDCTTILTPYPDNSGQNATSGEAE